MSTREAYQEKMTEGFMDTAGRMVQHIEQTEVLFQNTLLMLEDLNNRPYTDDYDHDYNRNQDVQAFISQYKRIDPVQQVSIDGLPNNDDDLPF